MRNFLRIYKIPLHLEPVFEREPAECLNENLPVVEVLRQVDGLEVAGAPTVAAPHSRPRQPASVQPRTGAETPGTD